MTTGFADPSLPTQIWMLARRSIKRTVRNPAVIVPTIIFPLVFLTINSQGLSRATDIPGFPTKHFLDFALAMTFMQSSLFATNAAGTNMAQDIEGGFVNRLALTPMRGVAMIFGQLAGSLVIGMLSATAFLTIGLATGVSIESGVFGALLLILLGGCTAVAMASLGTWLAIRTGSGEQVQGLFPLLFALFFLSSINMPRDLMQTDWFRHLATINPVSYLVEGLRSLIITGWDGAAIGKELLALALVMVIGIGGSARGIGNRVART